MATHSSACAKLLSVFALVAAGFLFACAPPPEETPNDDPTAEVDDGSATELAASRCKNGATQSCSNNCGQKGKRTCKNGAWGACSVKTQACCSGQVQSCVNNCGQVGRRTCSNGKYGACSAPNQNVCRSS